MALVGLTGWGSVANRSLVEPVGGGLGADPGTGPGVGGGLLGQSCHGRNGEAEVGFRAPRVEGPASLGRRPNSSLILSTRVDRVWPCTRVFEACWCGLQHQGSWPFGQGKGHRRGHLSSVPPLVDTSKQMGQCEHVDRCSEVPPPSSFPRGLRPPSFEWRCH